jgi:ankyrin repeat protein
MSTRSLPDAPSLDHLRSEARTLQRAVRAGDAEAMALVVEHHPRGGELTGAANRGAFALSHAQLAVARQYGFPSWPALKRHVEVARDLTRAPDGSVEGDDDERAGDELADRYLRLACLVYGGDQPARWERARQLLTRHPGLTSTSIHAAAAAGDVARVRALLAGDPGLADRPGGPHGWAPLMYAAYSRVEHPGVALSADHSTAEVARALLEAGADPNVGYLWHGLPTPFTALTGAFGEGEEGPVNQPRHPQWESLARALLEAGADANDGQALYNRQFLPDDSHLHLLFEFGLGSGSGGPWKARMGPRLDSPPEMVDHQLVWAVQKGFTDRVRLLLRHGAHADVMTRDGRGLHSIAMINGSTEIAALLAEHGARRDPLSPVERFVAAVMAGDAAEVDRLLAADANLAVEAAGARPGALMTAVERGDAAAVRRLVALGWDVDHRQRTTALHEAASTGDVEMLEVLLSLGADPTVTDTSFDSTPLGWAEYLGQDAAADLLRAHTSGG